MAQRARIKSVARLPRDINIIGGDAPGNGLEDSAQRAEIGDDFLASIAAARQEVQVLHEITHDLGACLRFEDSLSAVADRLKRLVPFDAIALYVKDGEVLSPRFVHGMESAAIGNLRIPFGAGISGWVAANRKPIINGIPGVEPGLATQNGVPTKLKSSLSVPMHASGGLQGVITLYHSSRDAFNQDHLRILLAIQSRISVAMENAFHFQQAQNKAALDGLTGLPNASSLFLHLDAELARCRRAETSLSLLVCDLDGFKQVNDTLGHLEGNRMLKEVATLLRSRARPDDFVARMGGDEFVLVLPDIPEDVLQSRIRGIEQAVVDLGCTSFCAGYLGVSVGYATFPTNGADAEALLAEADCRMYGIKRDRKRIREADSLSSLRNMTMAWCRARAAHDGWRKALMLRVLLVGADAALGNVVAGILGTHPEARLAGRVDYYPSTFEFGRILRDCEPDVLFISLASFNQAVELHRLAGQLVHDLQTVGVLRDAAALLPVDAIREGIHEFLEYPVNPMQVETVLRRVAALVASKPPQQPETEFVFAFFPARPGLGASTIAVNAAAALAEIPDFNVLLTDLDFHNGVLRLMLNLQDGSSLQEAAMRCGALDDSGWKQFVHRLGRLDVARAGKPLPEIGLEPIQVASLLRFARRRYRVICADLPGTLDPASMVVLRESARILLVATPEPMGLYMAREDMQLFEQLGLGHRVGLVLNRFNPKSRLEPEEAAHSVGAPLAAVIPNDYRAAQFAFRSGQPMAPQSVAGSAIRCFARSLVSSAPAHEEPEEAPFSLSTLFGLRKSQAS